MCWQKCLQDWELQTRSDLTLGGRWNGGMLVMGSLIMYSCPTKCNCLCWMFDQLSYCHVKVTLVRVNSSSSISSNFHQIPHFQPILDYTSPTSPHNACSTSQLMSYPVCQLKACSGIKLSFAACPILDNYSPSNLKKLWLLISAGWLSRSCSI